MHLVYIVEFVDRLASDTKPYYYIGSKANSTFVDGEIRDKKNAVYRGSSTKDDYQNLVASEKIKVSILGEFDDYEACLDYENQMHKHHNVVADPRYFNRAEAKVCNFHAPGYGTFRHSETGKIVKLPTDHAQVKSGEFVNVNCGYKTINDGLVEKQIIKAAEIPEGWRLGRLEKNIKRGIENANYGKTPSPDVVLRSIESRKKTYADDPERYLKIIETQRKLASETFKGVPKTPESNAKRSRPGLIMLKNSITGEVVRVPKGDKNLYDLSIWKNPAALSPPSGAGSRWSTDGNINVKLKSGENLPEGFRYGRTRKSK